MTVGSRDGWARAPSASSASSGDIEAEAGPVCPLHCPTGDEDGFERCTCSDVPAQPATGGAERCSSKRVTKVGSIHLEARCTKPKGHTGKHWEGDPQNEPPWNVDGNWSDDPTPSPALPVGQGEDRPLSNSLRLARHFLNDKDSSTASSAWLAAREILNWAEELERKGGKS